MNAGPLNLGDADLKGFAALDAGRYNAEVFEIKWDATKNPEGKMPVGTPMMKVQFRVLEPKIDDKIIDQDRRVFTQFVNPPLDYDKKKRSIMTGMIARFFVAIGEDEKKVLSGKFDPDFDDLKGRPCVVVLSKKPKYGTEPEDNEWENEVKGVKPASAGVGTSGLL